MTLKEFFGWYQVDEGYWFAPRMYGFGATPVTWQGWALTLGYVALLVADLRLVEQLRSKVWLAVALTVVLLALSWAKTEGGWRWRWGEDR